MEPNLGWRLVFLFVSLDSSKRKDSNKKMVLMILFIYASKSTIVEPALEILVDPLPPHVIKKIHLLKTFLKAI